MERSQSTAHIPLRKSFKCHQEIRRNYAKPIQVASALLIFALCCYYYTTPSSSETSQIDQEGGDERKKISYEQSSKVDAYMQDYCKEEGMCHEQNIEALTALLQLMQSTHSSTFNGEQSVFIEVASTVSQQNTQSANRLQITPFANSKKQFEGISQDHGRSRLMQLPLEIVKHPKVTSPASLSIFQQLSSMFGKYDAYEGIDSIVEENNGGVWRPETDAISITVRSKHNIRPTTIEITLQNSNSRTLELIGLSITLEQKAVLTSLGTYYMNDGTNRFNCLAVECKDEYDALIFKLGLSEIRNIKVFEAVEE